MSDNQKAFDLVPEYNIPAPNGRNRVWITPEGVVPRGSQGQPESDLAKLQREAEENALDIEVFDTGN